MKTTVLMFTTLSIIALLLLGACRSATPIPSSSMQVVEQGKEAGREDIETIYLNNCNGKANAAQTAERGQTVQIETGADLGVSVEVVQAAVSGKYATGSYISKNIQLTAPPGTSMFFKLKWTMAEQVGVVTNVGLRGISVKYHRFAPMDVQIIEQGNLGNCGSTTSSGASSPPANEPTHVPILSTATLIPVPTPILDTPPGSILEVGQMWYAGGKALVMTEASLNPNENRIWTKWKIRNLGSNDLVIKWTPDNFEAKNNLGNRANVWFYGNQEISMVLPGDATREYNNFVFTIPFTNLSVTEVIITVSFSNVQEARWRVPIYH